VSKEVTQRPFALLAGSIVIAMVLMAGCNPSSTGEKTPTSPPKEAMQRIQAESDKRKPGGN
jgi:hypothetical protein